MPQFWAPIGPRAPPHCGVCGVSSYATEQTDFSLLDVPFRRTDIGKRSFSCAAPATVQLGTPMHPVVINCDTLSVFKSMLKTHLFNIAYSWLTCSASASDAAALYGALQILLLAKMAPDSVQKSTTSSPAVAEKQPIVRLVRNSRAVC